MSRVLQGEQVSQNGIKVGQIGTKSEENLGITRYV